MISFLQFVVWFVRILMAFLIHMLWFLTMFTNHITFLTFGRLINLLSSKYIRNKLWFSCLLLIWWLEVPHVHLFIDLNFLVVFAKSCFKFIKHTIGGLCMKFEKQFLLKNVVTKCKIKLIDNVCIFSFAICGCHLFENLIVWIWIIFKHVNGI
jgi:hypothetical protein